LFKKKGGSVPGRMIFTLARALKYF